MLIALFIDVKITVLKKGIQMETKEETRSPFFTLIASFSARLYGRRSGRKKKKAAE